MDCLAITTGKLLDSDNDGMYDSWEKAYFGNLTQTAGGNFDKDEFTNTQEFTGGTDPTQYDIPGWFIPVIISGN